MMIFRPTLGGKVYVFPNGYPELGRIGVVLRATQTIPYRIIVEWTPAYSPRKEVEFFDRIDDTMFESDTVFPIWEPNGDVSGDVVEYYAVPPPPTADQIKSAFAEIAKILKETRKELDNDNKRD